MATATRAGSCLQCKGKGTILVTATIHEKGKRTQESYTLSCPSCGGNGQMSTRERKAYRMEVAAWCSCGQGMEAPRYHHDGECRKAHHPRKHHYDCASCGGVVQVG